MPPVDVVVVAYNSRDRLRSCVENLTRLRDVSVIVVDNASPDDSAATIADLDATVVALEENLGFAGGCNAGWRAGSAPYILLLNPDASIDEPSLEQLARVLAEEPGVGAAAPRIVGDDGELQHSQRLFPRLRSTYAQALFLHRLLPRAVWTDELVRDPAAYVKPGSPDWVSGACILLRREVLERLGGLDDGFFMYCEDTDICKRLRDLGFDIRFEPAAVVVHEGGASAPRSSLLPELAASRVRYAGKHMRPVAAALERVGVALGAATHVVVARGGAPARTGHARTLRHVLSRSAAQSPSRMAREH